MSERVKNLAIAGAIMAGSWYVINKDTPTGKQVRSSTEEIAAQAMAALDQSKIPELVIDIIPSDVTSLLNDISSSQLYSASPLPSVLQQSPQVASEQEFLPLPDKSDRAEYAMSLLSRIPGFSDNRESVRKKVGYERVQNEIQPKAIVIHYADTDLNTIASGEALSGIRGWDRPEYHIIVGVRDEPAQTANGVDFHPFQVVTHLDQRSYHAGELFNSETLSVSMITNKPPDKVMYSTLVAIATVLCDTYGIDPVGAVRIDAAKRDILGVVGHGELMGTDCPGFSVEPFRKDVADALALIRH